MNTIQIIISISISIAFTSIISYLFFQLRLKKQQQNGLQFELETKQLKEENEKLSAEKERLQRDLMQANMHIASIDTENAHLLKINQQKTEEVKEIQAKLSSEFENIANKILLHHSKEISAQNQENIGQLLTPLKEKIGQFERKVSETYDKEVRDKLSLQAEVKRLYELNQRISHEANNLTKALKGDVKKMGNWGEMILERVLEQSGLTEGREFRREVSDKNAEGKSIRPDVIIDLPDNKHLIIDSKLSLLAYDEYINAQTKEEKDAALKKQILSLREHIKGLHEKNYPSALSINNPDFVLMFIPVEASFAIAVETDSDLFSFAWERKIVPVSPSTLLATLKTVSSIWKQENQTKNAREIARQSGALYDKLVGFVSDLQKIGANINSLQGNYNESMQKLKNGKGNLISRAEKMKELGAKTNKSIPDNLP